jgi:hypothetical protein
MPHLEPTYLRYIYDGLVKGSIHPENAAELPEGLIGLYEEAFDERTSVVERQKLLERFAIWALLKKEVSAVFVAEVLGDKEDEIQDFISTYSSWFNSPESGKYQLYHERLKVYLLQKLSEVEVAKLNTLIVDYLVQKVNEAQQCESVSYCFENLSFHLFLKGYLTGDSDLLAQYCLDDTFKKRQFELSGFYEWEEKMMVFGVEYFSLKQDQICHQLVFEKTKIQHKKKDVNLLLELVRTNKFEILFSLFKSLNEIELEERIATAYLYILIFFEIFELNNKNFLQKKEIANQLLVIFEEHFQWDKGYYLAQFIDINLSFRLHCYFVQFGLDFKKYAILSSEHKTDFYGLEIRSDELKFLDPMHKEEAIYIFKLHNIFYYGFKADSDQIVNLVDELTNNYYNNQGLKYSNILDEHLTNILSKTGKTKLLRGDYLIEIVENEISSFNQLVCCIKYILDNIELTHYVKRDVSWLFQKTLINKFNGQLEFLGSWYGNDLKIQKINILSKNKESTVLFDNLHISQFEKLESKKKYNILKSIIINDENEIEVSMAFLDLSEHYSSLKNKDIFDLFSSLIVEYGLAIDGQKIELLQNDLINILINSDYDNIPSGLVLQDWDNWEDKIFEEIIIFFRLSQIQSKLKNFLQEKKKDIIQVYFRISYYEYSFKYGVELINLFDHFEVDFPEDEIVDTILGDLKYLIEENDYNQLQHIENSGINNIFQKTYFPDFYNEVKRIQIEQVRNSLSEYIFESIIDVKGLNHKTFSFFKENSNEYPGMYLWAQKRLSLKLLEQNEYLSYVTIKDNNDLLLERLLLNIVSKRENLKDELNIQILKHYGLDWVIELDNEYEKLIVN